MAKRVSKKIALHEADALLTGFPGFLSRFLIRQLAARDFSGTLWLLVQPRFRELAEKRVAELEEEFPTLKKHMVVLTGDITEDNLGLTDESWKELTKKVGVVWHLAAIYDLSVPEELAYKVNFGGTNGVLDFCTACANFRRLNYVSSCYVSGERAGTVYEDELDEGQSHHNHYESTKFWAEMEVQRRSEEIPTTIFRPAIIVGDSRTGETDKYDGPYYVFQMLRKLPSWMPFPNVGDGEVKTNIIPVDFASAAIAELGLRESATGKVFQIADPSPMKARDILSLALELLEKSPSKGRISPRLVEALLDSEKVEETVGVPKAVMRYFTHGVRYDTTQSREALAETGITCPHLSTYLQVLFDYVDRNPEKEFLDHRRV